MTTSARFNRLPIIITKVNLAVMESRRYDAPALSALGGAGTVPDNGRQLTRRSGERQAVVICRGSAWRSHRDRAGDPSRRRTPLHPELDRRLPRNLADAAGDSAGRDSGLGILGMERRSPRRTVAESRSRAGAMRFGARRCNRNLGLRLPARQLAGADRPVSRTFSLDSARGRNAVAIALSTRNQDLAADCRPMVRVAGYSVVSRLDTSVAARLPDGPVPGRTIVAGLRSTHREFSRLSAVQQ